MNNQILSVVGIACLSAAIITFVLTKKRYDKKAEKFGTLNSGIKELNTQISASAIEIQKSKSKLAEAEKSLHDYEVEAAARKGKIDRDVEALKNKAEKIRGEINEKISVAKDEYKRVYAETRDLQNLRNNADSISKRLEEDKNRLTELKKLLDDTKRTYQQKYEKLSSIMGKVDLYSRVDEFVSYGHFEMPEYLYETSDRFAAEIKNIRDQQKILIKSGAAFVLDSNQSVTNYTDIDKKIIDGQMKLVMRAFNIESDFIVGKVSSSNLERSLSRIEKLANDLEKLVASLRSGIALEYVKLKYQECSIQYQFTLKKKEEQEEQRLIREQMREEAKAEKEYRDALAAAEKEEQLYRDLLDKARTELEKSSEEERALTEAKILELERQLAEAEAKEERAKSLAQQTKRGHVYVISNIGSFGENVYKVGMTRRLDPMDRVKELGDASVPFNFDVHAMIFSSDAPAMEAALHRAFSHHRVNAVNLRKEFFKVELSKIKAAVDEIDGDDVEFVTTIAAEEFYESQRLREDMPTANL